MHGYVDLGGYLDGDPKPDLLEEEKEDTCECTCIGQVYPWTLNIYYCFPANGVLPLSMCTGM